MFREILTETLANLRGQLPLFAALLAVVALAFFAERALPRRVDERHRRWVHGALLTGLVGVGLVLAWTVLFLCDDAFISFRYARHLAEGHGLVWNLGERVEGYTNFLWTALLGGLCWLGFDIPKMALLGNVAAFVVALLLVDAAVRGASPRAPVVPFAVVALAGSRAFTTFASSGLETMPAAALVIAAPCLMARERVGKPPFDRGGRGRASLGPPSGPFFAGLALTAATLMRPDHVLFYACFGAALVVEDLTHRQGPLLRRLSAHRCVAFVLPFFVLYVPYFAARWHYYGDPLPNTYYAKLGAGANWGQGLVWAAHFVGATGAWAWLPVALVALAGRSRCPADTRLRSYAALSLVVFTLYVISAGGDFMEFRFFVPLLPLVAAATEVGLRARAAARGPLATALLAAAAVGVAAALVPIRLVPPRAIRWGIAMEPSYYRVTSLSPIRIDCGWAVLGARLKTDLADKRAFPPVAAAAIGALGYYSELPIVDALGLTNREIARKQLKTHGRPGHEKQASLDELLTAGAILDTAHVGDPSFEESTAVQIGASRLYFLRLDAAWASTLSHVPGVKVPMPARDAEHLARTGSRDRVLAARAFFATFLQGHPQRAAVLARLDRRLRAVADFEDDALPAGAVGAGGALRVVRAGRRAGVSGKGWLSSVADIEGGVGRVSLPVDPGDATELRFVVGGGSSDRLRVRLEVDGRAVHELSPTPDPADPLRLVPVVWSLEALEGTKAALVVEDSDPRPGMSIVIDAIHLAPADGDIRQRLAATTADDPGDLGALLQEAEALLPSDDPDLRTLRQRISLRWTLDEPPPGTVVTGTAFGPGPVAAAVTGQAPVTGHQGRFYDSYHGGDNATGRVVFPEIELTGAPIGVLVGGGKQCREAYVGLEVEGRVVARACGRNDETLRPASLATASFAGKRGRIVLVDEATGSWGHVVADDIVVQSDVPEAPRRRRVDREGIGMPGRTGEARVR